jgi:uncharacterized protein
MRLGDRLVVVAPRQRVWDFLLDPSRVAGCFPEVDRLERLDERRTRASVPVKVAFLTLRVVVEVELAEAVEPERAVFRVTATGPGSAAEGTIVVELREGSASDGAELGADAGPGRALTTIEWSADVEPRGMAAAVGQAQVERAAEPALRRAVDCLRRAVEGG